VRGAGGCPRRASGGSRLRDPFTLTRKGVLTYANLLARPPSLIGLLLVLLAPDCTGIASGGAPGDRCPDGPLLEAVRQAGTVRVIIGLALDIRPEADLTPQEVSDQRDRIATEQDRVLAEVGADSRVVRRYERLPQLALEVSEAGLCRLLASPSVRSVQLDREDAPG
jgi:hypothetical protein